MSEDNDKYMDRSIEIWFTENDVIEFDTKNLKPSEIIAMGAVLQQAGLDMMGELELEEPPEKTEDEGDTKQE